MIINLEGQTIQSLLKELPDLNKANIALILPIQYIDSNNEKREVRTSSLLSTPLPKRQKSLLGNAIPRAGSEETLIKKKGKLFIKNKHDE